MLPYAPKNAVILAAGPGIRMVPINNSIPKALLEVNGQPLIEQTISYLLQAGVTDITVVTGFMREQFEYLVDKYAVKLLFNDQYAGKNNLHSLALTAQTLGNTYVIPGDVWCGCNPFSRTESDSWYMVEDCFDADSCVKVEAQNELILTQGGNKMIGIAYLTEADGIALGKKLIQMQADAQYDDCFWENALYLDGKMTIAARIVRDRNIVEINTYEQLRNLDASSNHLHSDALNVIAETLGVNTDEICDITVLKKGMTNRSFLFVCRGRKYIMRIPGEGTDQLIDRAQEAAVYHAIGAHALCDDVLYINPENGYKLTAFLTDARNCNPSCYKDVRACMRRLRQFHQMNLKVDHRFDLFGQIEYYQSLWDGAPSEYRDYNKTKQQILSLRETVEAYAAPEVLTHIDAVPDNFLFVGNDREIRLIDWEYAGMQDPHVDIAMFCIYSMYRKPQVDKTIDAYFPEGCPRETRTKIYCYIAICGLLWSNWCEYKRLLGVTFGEYSLAQYRYAKTYFRYAQKRIAAEKDAKQ